MLLDKVLRFFVVAFMAIVGGGLMHLASPLIAEFLSFEMGSSTSEPFQIPLADALSVLIGVIAGGLIGYFSSPFLTATLRRFSLWVEKQINKMPFSDVVAGVVGLAIGPIIANLIGVAFANIPVVGSYIPVIFSIVFGYLGIHIVVKKQKEIADLIRAVPKWIKESKSKHENHDSDKKESDNKAEKEKEAVAENTVNNVSLKLLDTSVIIDGRIADICRTGFIEGKLLIPVFVLEELQHIADSADALKRVRGRRGLDVLQRLRTEYGMLIEIINEDYDDITEVDSKLVRMGQLKGAKIITNDFNLNKVSELRGVPVLNINELSNAVKPVVIPGETMHVTVVKEGKEHNQGVAYLDDGTMIVVENGRRFMNEAIQVEVTSALQTAAGRMIFAKPIVSVA